MSDDIGERVFAVRLALGDGVRKPLALRPFAEVVTLIGAKLFTPDYRRDASTISRWETGQQSLTLEDAAAVAANDPLQRGPAWLAWGPRLLLHLSDVHFGAPPAPDGGDPPGASRIPVGMFRSGEEIKAAETRTKSGARKRPA